MPSRISGACNGCRTKKQKCSGDRAGCSQCTAAGIVCTWPEQRKRGPAKGYIEGLEHRLHDAETLLLQLLPLVSPDQLATAASAAGAIQNGISRDSPDPGNRSSPPILNKKTGIDYWDRFPLDTVENIRRWQQDCAMHSHFKDEPRAGSNSRPGSVDFNHSQHQLPDRKPSMSMPQYRSMSNDSYRNSQDFGNVSSSSSRFNNVVQQTSSYAMPSQTAFADPSAWSQQQQQQQQQQPQQHVQTNGYVTHSQRQQHHHQPQQHSQQQQQHVNQQMMSAPMDVDTGSAFFSGEVKRHLFW